VLCVWGRGEGGGGYRNEDEHWLYLSVFVCQKLIKPEIRFFDIPCSRWLQYHVIMAIIMHYIDHNYVILQPPATCDMNMK
jgi:hypothetical protein